MSFMHLEMAHDLYLEVEYESPTRRILSKWVTIIEQWLAATVPDEVAEATWMAIQAEQSRIESFLGDEPCVVAESQSIDDVFRRGLDMHVQACQWLGLALSEAQAEPCRHALELLQAGDRLIAEAQQAILAMQPTLPL